MNLYYDVTKTRSSRHLSGLVRVGRGLLAELDKMLEVKLRPVVWSSKKRCLVDARSSRILRPVADEYYFLPELFSEKERPDFGQFLDDAEFCTVALYHDAIPLKFPEYTWPRSVERHPAYLKSLASFRHVIAISDFSRHELEGYWNWLEVKAVPTTSTLHPGADFLPEVPNVENTGLTAEHLVLAVGILEPRKNQMLLLEVCERLWRDGVRFDLILVGRENPHFAKPIVRKIRALRREGFALEHLKTVDDVALGTLYRSAYFTVLASRFEGFGLPLQESLWVGTPCVCSDIPVLRESSQGGGCLEFRNDDPQDLYDAMKTLLTDESSCERLRREIATRTLPTWKSAAKQLLDILVKVGRADCRHSKCTNPARSRSVN